MKTLLYFLLGFILIFKISHSRGYNFSVDYEFSNGDDGKTQSVEIMNEFSLTDRIFLGFDFLTETTEGKDFKYFNFHHLINFEPSKDVTIGLQNSMRFYKAEEDEMKYHYEIKAIFSHSKEVGIYKNFTLENGYRRKFIGFEPDVLKSNFKLDLRIVEGVDFVSDLETYIGLNKGYNFDLTLATLYVGAGFNLLKGDFFKDVSLAVKYRIDLGGKEYENRKGLMISFSKPLNIF
jgi:hypothetical protein